MKISEFFKGMPMEGMFANLNGMGRNYNLSFNGIDFIANTHLSLLASEYAKYKGKFHEFHDNLFRLYFTEGKDIGDIEILKTVAESINLNKDEMVKRITDGTYESNLELAKNLARQYEVDSTPTFIINNKHSIVGAQSIETFRKLLLN
jgi:predicted DsbA family dithiol-disulfide isomerase